MERGIGSISPGCGLMLYQMSLMKFVTLLTDLRMENLSNITSKRDDGRCEARWCVSVLFMHQYSVGNFQFAEMNYKTLSTRLDGAALCI